MLAWNYTNSISKVISIVPARRTGKYVERDETSQRREGLDMEFELDPIMKFAVPCRTSY